MRQSHAAQNVRCLGELDVVVTDNLDAVAPWVEEVEKRARQELDSASASALRTAPVVDHKSKMAALVGWLGTALLECEELVAQVHEGGSRALTPQFEIEQSAIEGESLFDIPVI